MPGAPSERWMLGGGGRVLHSGCGNNRPASIYPQIVRPGRGSGQPAPPRCQEVGRKGPLSLGPSCSGLSLQEQHPQLQGGRMGENQFNKFQTWAGIRRLSSKNATDPAPPRVAGG